MKKRPTITLLRVEDLKPYAKNARTHSEEQVAQIARSVQEFGWTNPILLDGKRGVVAGHGRLLAARKLGLERVPCIELAHLTPTQRRALVLADNQLALNAGWDLENLRLELEALKASAFDLEVLGFSVEQVSGLLDTTGGLTDPDDAPEPPKHPVSRPGDLWILGRHRVVCGDATARGDVRRVLGGVTPLLMVTDPPYGVDYDPEWRARAGLTKSRMKMGRVLNDERADWTPAWQLFAGDVAYVWHAGRRASEAQHSLESAGFEIRCQIIWAKDRFALSRGHYHWQHEPCWYAVRKGSPGHWEADRSQSTVWPVPARDDGGHGHGTQKPVECMRRPIQNNSSPGQAVYDPFVGSGTTIVAAEMTGRSCHAIEIAPEYVDVAVLRWQAFTGKQPTLDGDGRTFEAVARSRAARSLKKAS